MLAELIKSGVDVFRLNFSHGEHKAHAEVIKSIHTLNKELETNVAILADLQGPKIRIGKVEPKDGTGKIFLKKGDKIIFTTNKGINKPNHYYISYRTFAVDIEISHRILVDDGKLELKVLHSNSLDKVELEVMNDAYLSSNKGVNLPDTEISIPSITEKDSKDLEFILTQKVSWIALSFVRSSKDITKLRGLLEVKQHPAKIIAKVEKPEAVDNIEAIIDESDAVMVARGDLGVELPVEQTPVIQKQIVAKCIAKSKPVIIATQMMDSMIDDPVPTRAEVSDVANAIFDGADAVMLSGETAVGKHPLRVVRAMRRIIAQVEKESVIYNKKHTLNKDSKTFLSDAICNTVCDLVHEVNAAGIIGMTKSGYTAFALSSRRPNANIFVFTENEDLLNQVSLIWGVRAFFYNNFSSTDNTIFDVQSILKTKGYLKSKDIVLNTGSMPIEKRGATNTLKVTVIK
ncbi:UNVERIFIED_CONTAM: hypothetical protein GTU68_052978 [Idotea baltica]|nr:hypothetical protein [Idotea baltica]